MPVDTDVALVFIRRRRTRLGSPRSGCKSLWRSRASELETTYIDLLCEDINLVSPTSKENMQRILFIYFFVFYFFQKRGMTDSTNILLLVMVMVRPHTRHHCVPSTVLTSAPCLSMTKIQDSFCVHTLLHHAANEGLSMRPHSETLICKGQPPDVGANCD
jgi:hypothetical protein